MTVEELREQLERTRGELDAVRAELWQARDRISMMEMSRFWKLRNVWWAFKRRLGLAVPPATAVAHATPPAADLVRLPGLTPVPFRTGAADPVASRVDVVFLAGPDDVSSRQALDSVVRFCRPPVRFFVVRAEGAEAGREGLTALCHDLDALVFDPESQGFGRALRAGRSEYVFVVDAGCRLRLECLDRLVSCLRSDPDSVAAVPVSPGLFGPGADSAGVAPLAVAGRSARLYPVLEDGGGAAFVVRRSALAGREATTPTDLLRSLRAVGIVRLADDVWLDVADGVPSSSGGPALDGIAARLSTRPAQAARRSRGLARWEGRRVLFVLPVLDRGGGANVVFSEARACASFGVESRIFNLGSHRAEFESSYPSPAVPVVYGHAWDVVGLGSRYDAVVATANVSVEWLSPLAKAARPPVLGYYVQDYEPLFYPEGSADRARAEASYSLIDGLRLFAKTAWNAEIVREKAGVPCEVIGPSFDVDTYQPRLGAPPGAPVRIAAMIRPSTPRRQPRLTLEVLREVVGALGDGVEVFLFGVEDSDPALASLPLDFPHRFLGVLDERSLAALFAQVHVFADFSSYQAMGLTALEAMGAGAAVVLPKEGGAASFARDRENAFFVDTSSAAACGEALRRLVANAVLRQRIAKRAVSDVAAFTPESAAFRMLEVLFGAA